MSTSPPIAYARLREGKFGRTIEVSSSVMVDLDTEDRILGVETLDGSDWRDALVKLAMDGRLTTPKRPASASETAQLPDLR